MKLSWCICLSLLVVSVSNVAAKPFDEAQGWLFNMTHPPNRKIITPPTSEMSADDYVIALAKAGGVNFIADATQIPADTQMEPFPASQESIQNHLKPYFYGVLEDFRNTCQLASLRYDETTFLLWNKPERMTAARLINVAVQQRGVETDPNEFALYADLDEYARVAHGWTGGPRPHLKLKFGELPPELQLKLTALARHHILRPEFRRELFFTDAYWQTARVRRGSGYSVPNDPALQTKLAPLFIGGQDEAGRPLPFFQLFNGWPMRPDNMDWEVLATLRPPNKVTSATPAQPASPSSATANPLLLNPLLPIQQLYQPDLEAEGALGTKVSVEAKRQPLGKLLATVRQQSGVTLSPAEGTPAPTALVTLRVQEMPLATLMGALSRVYGVTWAKQSPTTYVMQPSRLDPLQTLLLQSGGDELLLKHGAMQTLDGLMPDSSALIQEINAELNGPEPNSPRGVPITTLPPDLQQSLRQEFEGMTASDIINSYNSAFKYLSPETIVYLSPTTPPERPVGWGVLLTSPHHTLMYTDVRSPDQPKPQPFPRLLPIKPKLPAPR